MSEFTSSIKNQYFYENFNNMRYYGFLFLFLTAFAVKAQTGIDSLRTHLTKTTAATTQRADLLNELGYRYWIVDSRKSLELGTEALALSQKLSYSPGVAKAHRVLGVAYWTTGSLKKALENLTEARQTYSRLKDEEGVANCLLNTGMIYADIRDFATALKLYDEAIGKFSKLGLNGRIATAYTKIGIVMMEKEQLYDAREYLTNALDLHTTHNFTYGMAEAHNKLGRLYLELKQPEQAGYHLRKAIVLSKQVNDEDGVISTLILFGKLLRMEGDYESSEAHLEIALERAEKKHLIKYTLEALDEYRKLKKQQGKPGEAIQYYDEYLAVKDSLYDIDKAKQIAAVEFSNELEKKTDEIKSLNKKELGDRIQRWVLAAAVMIISVLSFFLIRSLRKKNRSQGEILVSNDLMAQSAIESERQKHALLEEELHFKNRELTSYALNFVQKNELLSTLEEKVKEMKSLPAPKQGKAIAEVEKIIRNHKNVDKDWEDFKLHFEQVHDNFFVSLKNRFPHLSSNDLKLAALTRLNMNIKETSNILGISPDSVKTARYRLRKKMGVEQDADLISFLVTLEKQS